MKAGRGDREQHENQTPQSLYKKHVKTVLRPGGNLQLVETQIEEYHRQLGLTPDQARAIESRYREESTEEQDSGSDVAASTGTKTGGSAGKIDHKSVPQISAGCFYCGFDADPGTRFCTNCGEPLSGWSIVPAHMGRTIKGAFIHLAVYLAVNTLLVIIWALKGQGLLSGAGFPWFVLWFVFPVGVWGFCVWVHFLRTRRV